MPTALNDLLIMINSMKNTIYDPNYEEVGEVREALLQVLADTTMAADMKRFERAYFAHPSSDMAASFNAILPGLLQEMPQAMHTTLEYAYAVTVFATDDRPLDDTIARRLGFTLEDGAEDDGEGPRPRPPWMKNFGMRYER